MTVYELRELLFAVEDQRAQVVIPEIAFGRVNATQGVAAVGHRDDPPGYVSIVPGDYTYPGVDD